MSTKCVMWVKLILAATFVAGAVQADDCIYKYDGPLCNGVGLTCAPSCYLAGSFDCPNWVTMHNGSEQLTVTGGTLKVFTEVQFTCYTTGDCGIDFPDLASTCWNYTTYADCVPTVPGEFCDKCKPVDTGRPVGAIYKVLVPCSYY